MTATLIWYDSVVEAPDARPAYQVAGPVLETPPASPYFVLAPLEQGDFAERLYRAEVSLADLQSFFQECEVAEGRLTDGLEFVVASHRAALWPLLDAWRVHEAGEALPYRSDINAFLAPDGQPVYVTADAYRRLQREPERFATTWICEECGEAEDAAMFLWTAHRGDAVQVRLSIENQGGVWTVRFHPFKIQKEAMTDA